MTHTPTKWAEIDVLALRDNAAALKRFASAGCQMMAMVKANGYGHGSLIAARAVIAGGVDWLGVSSVAEGLELRRAGFTAPMLNVGWTPLDDIGLAARNDIDVTVFTVPAVHAASRAALENRRKVRVQWKLDTGMGRLGTPLADVSEMRTALVAASDLEVTGIFTHYASADLASLDVTERQYQHFDTLLGELRQDFPGALAHSANSAALLRFAAAHGDMTRPGIALYGYAPPHCTGIVDLRPAMTVRTLVTQVKRVAAGDSIGYGHAWTASRPSLVAMAAMGYADGLNRHNGDTGFACVNGVLCPIVGRISMDQCAIDVSAVDGVTEGSVVTLLGGGEPRGMDAAAIAERIGTIPNEVLCAVGARVPRVAVNDSGIAD